MEGLLNKTPNDFRRKGASDRVQTRGPFVNTLTGPGHHLAGHVSAGHGSLAWDEDPQPKCGNPAARAAASHHEAQYMCFLS